jgi:hypothetical protein
LVIHGFDSGTVDGPVLDTYGFIGIEIERKDPLLMMASVICCVLLYI